MIMWYIHNLAEMLQLLLFLQILLMMKLL